MASNRLPVLAAEIADHHSVARGATREAIRHAIKAGRRLAEAKALVGHGGWLAWLQANVPGISVRTVQRYLAAAHRAGENDTVSLFRLRDLARRPRPKREPTVEETEAAAHEAMRTYCAMIEAVADDMKAPGAYEAFRQAQDMGLRAWDRYADAIRKWDRRMAESIEEIAAFLTEVRARLPPDQWPLWLQDSFGWSPEEAAVLVEAAAAVKEGRAFDVEAVAGVLAALERAAA